LTRRGEGRIAESQVLKVTSSMATKGRQGPYLGEVRKNTFWRHFRNKKVGKNCSKAIIEATHSRSIGPCALFS
jgi:hypothetical protein